MGAYGNWCVYERFSGKLLLVTLFGLGCYGCMQKCRCAQVVMGTRGYGCRSLWVQMVMLQVIVGPDGFKRR